LRMDIRLRSTKGDSGPWDCRENGQLGDGGQKTERWRTSRESALCRKGQFRNEGGTKNETKNKKGDQLIWKKGEHEPLEFVTIKDEVTTGIQKASPENFRGKGCKKLGQTRGGGGTDREGKKTGSERKPVSQCCPCNFEHRQWNRRGTRLNVEKKGKRFRGERKGVCPRRIVL